MLAGALADSYLGLQEDFGRQDHEEYQLRRSSAALSSEELARLHIAAAICGAEEAPVCGEGPAQLPPALAAAAAAAHREEAAHVRLALRQDEMHVRTLQTTRDCLRRVVGSAGSPTPPAAEQLNGVHVRPHCCLPLLTSHLPRVPLVALGSGPCVRRGDRRRAAQVFRVTCRHRLLMCLYWLWVFCV